MLSCVLQPVKVIMLFLSGLTANQRVRGKMDVFLERNLPEHYAKLLSVHVL